VGDVERTLGLDVEVSARPGTTDPAAARADLDAFADAPRSSPATSPRTAPARPCCRRSSPTCRPPRTRSTASTPAPSAAPTRSSS
jgi:hypothetical protein